MIIADSTFIVEGLIQRKALFEENEDILTLDFAVYEVSNSIWKHEFLLKDLRNGRAYLSEFIQLIESESIRLIQLSPSLLQRTYALASKHKRTIYDIAFVSLSLEMELELKTFDLDQERVYNQERGAGN
jgi:predicted nucleic acid-binding protein